MNHQELLVSAVRLNEKSSSHLLLQSDFIPSRIRVVFLIFNAFESCCQELYRLWVTK